MRSMISKLMLITLCVIFSAGLTAQDAVNKAEGPILVTSCGQSPGPMKFKFMLSRLKIEHDYNLMVTAKDLVTAQENGKPFKSLIIVTGASLKGMGAAGVSIKDELSRTEALIAEAKKQGITLIGAHVEGMARRAKGAAAGDNSDEQSIDAVCPASSFIVVRKDGDEDQRFTNLSREKNIPVIFFEKNMELLDVIKNIYQ